MKRTIKTIKKKNKRIKELKFALRQLRAELKETRKAHKAAMDNNNKKTDKLIAQAEKEKEYWLNMIEKMRILERETKAQLATINHADLEIWQKLGIKQDSKNRLERNVNSISKQISSGARNLQ